MSALICWKPAHRKKGVKGQAANRALTHEVDLLGSGSIHLGQSIDWLKDYKTGHSWPPRFMRDIENDEGADLFAWYPFQLKRVLEDGGYMPEVVMKAWREHGILLTSSGRLTYVSKCSGGKKAQRVYLMKANKTTWSVGM